MKAHLTEKTMLLASQAKPAFTFIVKPTENGQSIIKEAKKQFNVDVIDIRFLKTAAKNLRFKGIKGKKAAIKKAILTLQPKQKIDLFDIKEEKHGK